MVGASDHGGECLLLRAGPTALMRRRQRARAHIPGARFRTRLGVVLDRDFPDAGDTRPCVVRRALSAACEASHSGRAAALLPSQRTRYSWRVCRTRREPARSRLVTGVGRVGGVAEPRRSGHAQRCAGASSVGTLRRSARRAGVSNPRSTASIRRSRCCSCTAPAAWASPVCSVCSPSWPPARPPGRRDRRESRCCDAARVHCRCGGRARCVAGGWADHRAGRHEDPRRGRQLGFPRAARRVVPRLVRAPAAGLGGGRRGRPPAAVGELAGRPAWRDLLRIVSLRNLTPDESRQFLVASGCRWPGSTTWRRRASVIPWRSRCSLTSSCVVAIRTSIRWRPMSWRRSFGACSTTCRRAWCGDRSSADRPHPRRTCREAGGRPAQAVPADAAPKGSQRRGGHRHRDRR